MGKNGIWKKIVVLYLALMVVCCLFVGCASKPSLYRDGTYTGIGQGIGGEITVTLSTKQDVITVNEIVGNLETEGIGGYEAIKDGTFAAQIEDAQSADIDGIAGATITSDGVRQATSAALEQAKN